ncbi:MAG: sigma-70 family RNA polymerase sigma factor [Spirochaetota bacterium]
MIEATSVEAPQNTATARVTAVADGADPLSYYLQQIADYPLLSADEEQALAIEISRLKAEIDEVESSPERSPRHASRLERLEDELRDAKHRMVRANLRLVVSIAKRYQHQGLGLLDLIDEGNIGLIEAVDRFNFRKGCRFSTYGTWWIRQAIVKALADKGRVIRIPVHMLTHIRRCFSMTRQLTEELGRTPSVAEIAERLGCGAERVEEVTRFAQDAASLDVTVDDDNSTRLSDLIEDEAAVAPAERAYRLTVQDHIRDALSVLTDREKHIIKLRFGIGSEGPYTLEETGERLGITRERVRQLQEKAIRKLRQLNSIRAYRDL